MRCCENLHKTIAHDVTSDLCHKKSHKQWNEGEFSYFLFDNYETHFLISETHFFLMFPENI